MRATGKRIAVASGVLALLVVSVAAFALGPWAVESWYVKKLDAAGTKEELRATLTKLGAMRSRRAFERLCERALQESPEEVRTLLPLEMPEPPRLSGPLADREDRLGAQQFMLRALGGRERGAEIAHEILGAKTASIRLRICFAQDLAMGRGGVPEEKRPRLISTFIEGLRSDDLLARAGGAFGIGIFGTDASEAIPALVEVCRDDRLRPHAEWVLRKVRGETAREASAEYREREELPVLAAAFRRAFTDEPNPRSSVYYIEWKRGDEDGWRQPSPELLASLAGIRDEGGPISVLPASKMPPAEVDDLTGRESYGPICTVTIVKWIGQVEVEINISISGGPLAGSGFRARAIKIDSGWQVSPGWIRDRFIS